MLILGIVFDGSILPLTPAGFAGVLVLAPAIGVPDTAAELLLPVIEAFADTGGIVCLRAASAALGETRPDF